VIEGPNDAGKWTGRPGWQPFFWIILASGLAHLWCLGSVFYLDDMTQIRDCEAVRNGEFYTQKLVAWTTLSYALQYRLFGMSVVGFHAVNWLLHTAVGTVFFGLSRDLIRGKGSVGVALFGALLFVVHPLCSEIPNYARTQDLAWVMLFSLLAGWALLRVLRGGSLWLGLGCVACVVGATFSKGPGLFHALMVCGGIGLASLKPHDWARIRARLMWLLGGLALAIALLWFAGALDGLLGATRLWSEPRFIGHGYTLARVFWEFAWRAVLPVRLCSDHLIAETLVPPGTPFWKVPDRIAMLAMVGLLAMMALGAWLTWRRQTRLLGLCLALFVLTIAFRLLYLVPEFMPEYRIYPGMPWFCLGAAMVLAAAWRWLFESASPRVPALILLACFAWLSAQRSFVWHDLDRLTADVLKSYPARARAFWELQDRDVALGKWQTVIDRQGSQWPEIERHFIMENRALAPAREIPSGDFVLAMVATRGDLSRALGHTTGPAAAMQTMRLLEAHLTQMQMTPQTHATHFGYFYHDLGLAHEMLGNYSAAAACLREESVPTFWLEDLRRVEKKLAAGK
jgi:hypothetical protein